MSEEYFDLNDIDHEPSDEQLGFLMDAVAQQVRLRLTRVMETRIARLQADLADAMRTSTVE